MHINQKKATTTWVSFYKSVSNQAAICGLLWGGGGVWWWVDERGDACIISLSLTKTWLSIKLPRPLPPAPSDA